MRNKNWPILGVIAILVATIVSGCVIQPPVEMEFSVGECDLDPYGEEEGVRDVTWLDDTTLEIKVYVIINCAEEIEDGNYELVNNKIILKYISPECEVEECVKCLCGFELTYTFTNLENKDYIFEVERITGS
jgi:hypothetical protein